MNAFSSLIWNTITISSSSQAKGLCNSLKSDSLWKRHACYTRTLYLSRSVTITKADFITLQTSFRSLEKLHLEAKIEGQSCLDRGIDWATWKTLTRLEIIRYNPHGSAILGFYSILKDYKKQYPPSQDFIDLVGMELVHMHLPLLRVLILVADFYILYQDDIEFIETLLGPKRDTDVELTGTITDFRWIYYFTRRYKKLRHVHCSFPSNIDPDQMLCGRTLALFIKKGSIFSSLESIAISDKPGQQYINRTIVSWLSQFGSSISSFKYQTLRMEYLKDSNNNMSEILKVLPATIREITLDLTYSWNMYLLKPSILGRLESLVSLKITLSNTKLDMCELLEYCQNLECLDLSFGIDFLLMSRPISILHNLKSLGLKGGWLPSKLLGQITRQCHQLKYLDIHGLDLLWGDLLPNGAVHLDLSKNNLDSLTIGHRIMGGCGSNTNPRVDKLIRLQIYSITQLKRLSSSCQNTGYFGYTDPGLYNQWYYSHSTVLKDKQPICDEINIRQIKDDELKFVRNYFLELPYYHRQLIPKYSEYPFKQKPREDPLECKWALNRGYFDVVCGSLEHFTIIKN
ncbi:hypothetical protein CLU79DRAFT_840796 [Phycomyces nitens]|nr:hypothetical protein CLU79DRAFT_840796 [Phycomyces nitens]